MEFEVVPAPVLAEPLIQRLAVLLGRAYTDQRHVDGFSQQDRSRWADDFARVHSHQGSSDDSPPRELMPDDFMKRFPTIRNAARLAEDRRESLHLFAETNGRVASHVSLWPQYFVFDDFRFSGGYIEDVATDPLDLGRGLAQEGMRAAAAVARERGLEMLGLATGLKGYYERLGWLPWHGNHTFHIAERNAAYPDQPLYLFPLSAAAKKVAASDGPMRSWRLRRFGDVPEVFRG